eukprot:TRINITY_DN2335_c1_g1_i1.p1 TRINITY_DN2335_c1_g1~~TRINITY_DN2335_c1_g1_i1.p1  ORF type:complete len:216 (-),score=29.03 TRINITY_DN2335_c1_g1_i1:16-663(-)
MGVSVWVWLGLVSVIFSQNVPVLTLNSPVEVSFIVLNSSVSLNYTATFKFDSRTLPIKQYTQTFATVGENQYITNTWTFANPNSVISYVSREDSCINSTITSSQSTWPTCSGWTDLSSNQKLRTCTISSGEVELKTSTTLTFSPRGSVTNIRSTTSGDGKVTLSNVKILTPDNAPPFPSDFALPAECTQPPTLSIDSPSTLDHLPLALAFLFINT